MVYRISLLATRVARKILAQDCRSKHKRKPILCKPPCVIY